MGTVATVPMLACIVTDCGTKFTETNLEGFEVSRMWTNLLCVAAIIGFAGVLTAQDNTSQDDAKAQDAGFVYEWPEVPTGLDLPAAEVPEKEYYAENLINQKLPNLQVQEFLSDKPELEGKMVLIDFWATWCGPCKAVIPELGEFNKEFGEKLVVLGISDEEKQTVLNMTEPKLEYASAIDTEGTIKNHVKVRGIPHVVIVDPYGYVRWQGFPGMEDHKLTKEVIQGLLDTYVKDTGE